MSAAVRAITMEPSGGSWRELLLRGASTIWDSRKQLFRRELGLPLDRPIVMTGHQCSFWHAGILAKYLAADALARNADAAAAWLWVDQDTDETGEIAVPVRNEWGVLKSATWRLKKSGLADMPSGSSPPFVPERFVGQPALGSVAAGLARIEAAMRENAGAPTAAAQVARALGVLMSPLVMPGAEVMATAISRTSLWREVIEKMARDPEVAVAAYNRAVAGVPQAGVGALAVGGGRIELPLWKLEAGKARARAFAGELAGVDAGALAPRALLLTGIMRLAGCEVFIHGLGGGVYDVITERWLGEWLGATLTPTVVATADVLLPLSEREVSKADVARAVWLAHRAKHDPGVLDASEAAGKKQAFLEQIAVKRERGEHPRAEFLAMHRLLDAYRSEHNAALTRLESDTALLKQLASEAIIARSRTWAFAFHEQGALNELKTAVELAISASAR